MNLQHIRTNTCPHCGAETIVSEAVEFDAERAKIRVHSCGERWETRTFVCGFSTAWVPNFSREEPQSECRASHAYARKMARRAVAKQKVIALIDELDVDDAGRAELKRWL